MPGHPVLAGAIVGVAEITVTFPLEFVKRQLQLQQQASALSQAAPVTFQGPLHVIRYTVRTHGPRGLYCGFSSFIAFAWLAPDAPELAIACIFAIEAFASLSAAFAFAASLLASATSASNLSDCADVMPEPRRNAVSEDAALFAASASSIWSFNF